MKRNIIKNYRQIHYWENFFLDSAVYSIGQSVGFSYEEGLQIIAAITGDLFAYMYSEEKYCDSGLTGYFFLPETIKEAYALFGHSCIYLSREGISADFDRAVCEIRRSIDAGIPVLAWGCGGIRMQSGEKYDPLPEGCLIGGYDDENNLLYVNLYPGEERLAGESACGKPGVDEYGYIAVFADEALATTEGIFILGEKIPQTDLRGIYHRALFSIPQFLSMGQRDGYVFGRAAFEKWASVLRTDQYWQDEQTAEANCWDKHCHAYCALCTSIGVCDNEGIVTFLRKVAEALPDITEANAVLPLFGELRRLNQSIWEYQGGFMPLSAKLTEHAYREHLAELLCRMGYVCEKILFVFGDNISGRKSDPEIG